MRVTKQMLGNQTGKRILYLDQNFPQAYPAARTLKPSPEGRRLQTSQTGTVIFEIRDAEEGCFARAPGHPIFTQATICEELRSNVPEAISLHFEDAAARPRLVQMH